MASVSFSIALLFLVCPLASCSDCGQAALTMKSTECIGQISANIGQGVCPAWNSYVCCLKDAFSSCPSLSSVIDSTVNTMKTSYASQPQFAAISSCPDAVCSGGSGGSGGSGEGASGETASEPSVVEKTLEAMIELSDPTTFNLQSYIDAVKTKIGASANVNAVLKAWEIILQYALPEGTTETQLKAAIAKAMNVVETAIKIVMAASGGRRLNSNRRLAANADVTITTDTAENAKSLKTVSAGAAVDSLKSELGGDVVVSKEPKAIAKVETKITTETSKVSDLKAQVESVRPDVGGTITADENPETESLESSNSRFSFIFAPLLILLVKMFQ
jgi:hypothetical protein